MILATRRRIAHVTGGLEMGGQEKLLLEFAQHADRSHYDLCVISLTGRGKLAEILEDRGCPVYALDAPPGLRPSLVWRLTRLFRQLNIEIVHTHDDRPLVYGQPAAWLAGIRERFHTHHHGHIAHVTARQNRLASWSACLCRAFVCVSEDAARHMLSQGISTERLLTLHNGIDLDRFPYQGPNPTGPAVTVARLSPEKDQATLIRAVAEVVKHVPDFRLEIAGDGPCRQELVDLAQQLSLGEHVRFLGEVRDIPALLSRARLFTLSSLTEGVSLTILEAMARGLPVVATQVGGNCEVIQHDETGFLVPSAQPATLAQALQSLWQDSVTGARWGRAGRERVESHFDVRDMVRRYEALYESHDHLDGIPRGKLMPMSVLRSERNL